MDLVQRFTADYNYLESLGALDFAITAVNLLMASKFTFILSMLSAFADSEKKLTPYLCLEYCYDYRKLVFLLNLL